MFTDERTHFSDFEFHGAWWLPETDQRKVHGNLRFSQEHGIGLSLRDPLKDEPWKPGPVTEIFDSFPIVLGQSDKLELCTLFQAMEVSKSAFPGHGACRLRAGRLYIGGHFEKEDDIQFKDEQIELTHLEEWVGRNQFDVNFRGDRTVIEVPQGPEEILRVHLEKECVLIEIHSGTDVNFSFSSPGGFTGRRRAYIVIKSDDRRPHESFELLMRRLTNFFTLCIGEPVYPRKITGRPARWELEPSERNQVDIFIPLLRGRPLEDVSYARMPVPFVMLREKLPSVIKSWFDLHDKIEPVIGLLTSTYYNSQMYVETVFLTLMQAVEMFHRRLIGGSYLMEAEWQPYRDQILGSIPAAIEGSHRTALTNRLRWGHEYSLRKRIAELLEHIEEKAREHVTAGVGDFAGVCADTRNNLVHEGGGNKSLKELWEITKKVRVFLNVLIWNQLGMEPVTRIIYKNFE